MPSKLRIRAARRQRLVLSCTLTLALAGCGGAPPPAISAGPNPADPGTAIIEAPYVPVTAGTVNHQPVDPRAWREMNERVAPRGGHSR